MLSWPLKGQLWPPAYARARDRPGWPEAQKGGVGGHQPRARGPLGPLSGHNVLDCSTAWQADREQWLVEGLGSRPTWEEQLGLSKGLVLTTCPATLGKESTSLSGRQAGGLAFQGPQQSSLPLCLTFPVSPAVAITWAKCYESTEPCKRWSCPSLLWP